MTNSISDTVAQFNLLTVEKEKWDEGIKTTKTFEQENTRSGVKCCDSWKKKNFMQDVYTRGVFR